jgi:hypothetical protein
VFVNGFQDSSISTDRKVQDMAKKLKILMIGAMYENGGNTTHRFLDGHPELAVYPFESQLGTKYVQDHLTSLFPVKYRWPVFPLHTSPAENYQLIIDEEGKIRSKTPDVSKFRHAAFNVMDADREKAYVQAMRRLDNTRANNVYAFFKATFDAWTEHKMSGREKYFVGYSPIVGIDGEKILSDFPDGHVLHIVRNPWSAYADTKKRPVPLSLSSYMLGWNLNQYMALALQKKYPERFHLIRIEDVMSDPLKTLGSLCKVLGLHSSKTLAYPSWNGEKLTEVYPWGTLRKISPKVNLETARELSKKEIDEIRNLTWQYLDVFGYADFLTS